MRGENTVRFTVDSLANSQRIRIDKNNFIPMIFEPIGLKSRRCINSFSRRKEEKCSNRPTLWAVGQFVQVSCCSRNSCEKMATDLVRSIG